MQHLQFTGRLRRADLISTIDDFHQAHSLIAPSSQLLYRPREANFIADYLAGQGSRYLLDLQEQEKPLPEHPVRINSSPPLALLLKQQAMIGGTHRAGRMVLCLMERIACTVSQLRSYTRHTDDKIAKGAAHLLMATRRGSGPLVVGPAKGKLRLPKSGFSQESPKRYRCDFCRKRGHLSRNCPFITFWVSLSEGAMVHQKVHEKVRDDDEEEEEDAPVLVTTADPETLPDAAIRLVERRAVRANLKEEQDRLKQHEAEAKEILRRERERKGQAHEISEREKKILAKEAKKKNTKEKKSVLKDKGVVKAKKAVKPEVKTPEAKKPEAKKPVAEEEYIYYTSPSQEPEPKPVPKVEDGKRKKAAPKLVAKKQKAKPPTPPKSSSETGDDEGEEEGLLTDDFPPEGEESTSPSQESELFEAESAVPRREVGAPKRTEVMPKKRPACQTPSRNLQRG